MDTTSWTGAPSAHQAVGSIPMGFEWSPRDQNLSTPESTARSIGLQNAFHTAPNQNGNNNGGSGNGNGVVHGQPTSSAAMTGPGGVATAVQHGHLGENGIGGDQLIQSLPQGLSGQGDLQLRTTPPSSRNDFHHPSHQHHGQQPPQQHLHLHHAHSQYHHPQAHPHELSQHDQSTFPPQHAAYPSAHYYPEAEQHDPYDHGDRTHGGGLVGHSYGHSPQDNLAALTPPPSAPVPQHDLPPLRTRLTNTIWEDERTFCFQVDVKGVCVARRADNHMVNGTKLLNVVGMSRGKRDGILKNEKGRVVVKVGAMHLKGVWIPLERAIHHAKAHNIEESLYPLLVEDPSAFLYQHPHTAAMAPDMRWSTQSQPQPTHAPYHESDSPKARHSDIHSNHHFTQGVHGDYYSQQQHHPVFRSHNGNSPHGSPHGSNGSVSGDEDPNLVSPFEYRVQSSMPTGLIGIPSGGAPIPDLRTGGHHAYYNSHQASPGPYYGAAAAAHVQPKYQDSILHPNQHQLQLGGPLASDSPPSTSSPHGKMMESRLYSYAPYHKAF